MTEENGLKKMNEQDLIELLRTRRKPGLPRGRRCPDEMQLAAYVDRRLDSKTRESLEAHVADCDFCLSQVSFLAQAADWTSAAEVLAPLLARARNLVPRKEASATKRRWEWAAAAAACVVLLVALIAFYLHRQTGTTSNEPLVAQPEQRPAPASQFSPAPRNPDVVASSNTGPSPRANLSKPEGSVPLIRNAETDNHAPKLTFPREGAVVKRAKLEFHWQAVSDVNFYEVSIVSANGDPVIVRQTDGTRLELPPDVQLISGAKYFVSVRAHLREGKTARSGVVSFKVVD